MIAAFKPFSIFLVCIIVAGWVVVADAVESFAPFARQTLPLELNRSQYQLSAYPVMPYSEMVYADTTALLKDRDYEIDYRRGLLTIRVGIAASHLFLEYVLIPPSLMDPVYRYQTVDLSDSSQVIKRSDPWQFLPDDGKLVISGVKTFALTLSDNQTLDVKQSLFLNLTGEVSPGVQIEARLSDSQSKLSPEGDSRELSSLDDVYFKIFGAGYEIALGNLEWGIKGTRFINYHSKFEGVNLWYDRGQAAQFAYSANNGKDATVRIEIIDGKQGPYYLRATGFQQNFIVIAGSERVYLDGVLLQRGSDYSIDYSEGSVMFRRLVSSINNITARFQYSDEYYKQTMFFNSSELRIGDHLRLRHGIIVQTDDKRSPLQYDFSPADIDSLRQAGDDPVWGQGIFEVEDGAGLYKKLSTPGGIEFFEYVPGDSTAVYLIHFSFVGLGNGDYEEFSAGKYRYLGTGLGSWLPLKRLIPPVFRSNTDLRLSYDTETLAMGVEALYAVNDKNSYSSLDDDDNDSFLLYCIGNWKLDYDRFRPVLSLAFESRTDEPYLFADASNIETDYDLYQLTGADSLAFFQFQTGLTINTEFDWNPELTWRYRKTRDQYDANTLRFISRSRQWRFIPALEFRNTITSQEFENGTESQLNYHRLSGTWVYRALALRMDYLYDSMLNSANGLSTGTRYVRWNPSLGIGDSRKWLSKVAYLRDRRDLRNDAWTKDRDSDQWTLNQMISTALHQLNLEASRKVISKVMDGSSTSTDPARTAFNLVNLRSYHYLLKQAVTIYSTYNLNQTEFFPRIRELEYVGNGQGLYDSTGVYVPEGDYDYVFITSEQGVLSSEINAQANLYLKPSYLGGSPLWRRINTDIMISATEQNTRRDDWKTLVFYPGSAFNDSTTIYGRQNIQQTLWLDLISGKLNAQMQFSLSRSLDQRYQELSRTSGNEQMVELELRQVWGNNYRLRFEHNQDTDTRYNSRIDKSGLSLQTQRNLNPLTQIQLDLTGSVEQGENTITNDRYTLHGIGLRPSIRSTFRQKYRINSSFSFTFNQRQGTPFLTFLPDKRQGLITFWNLNALYRLNAFTSFSLEYSGNSYPKDKTRHQLKLEFKAEI